MTPTAHISLLLVGLVVALGVGFGMGVAVGGQRAPVTSLPQNFDVAASLAGEKAAREEARAYQALLTQALDRCRPETRDAH